MITKYKNRYLLVESSEELDTRDRSVSSSLMDSFDRQLGEISRSDSNPKPLYQYNTKVFILRIKRGTERKIMLALSFIKNVNGKRVGLYTVKTSGTIRSLLKYCKDTYH